MDGTEAAAQNGMVVMVRREMAAFKSQKRLMQRVLGIEVQHKQDQTKRRYVFLHGMHSAALRGQLKAAEDYLKEGGGLIAGDWNHVPCKRWRVSGVLGARDKWVQKLCGGVCGCCGTARFGACRVVGGRGREEADEVGCNWNRFFIFSKLNFLSQLQVSNAKYALSAASFVFFQD